MIRGVCLRHWLVISTDDSSTFADLTEEKKPKRKNTNFFLVFAQKNIKHAISISI